MFMSDFLKILRYAMEMEKQGESFYLKYRDESKDEKQRKFLKALLKLKLNIILF